jgi:hypothetical protein
MAHRTRPLLNLLPAIKLKRAGRRRRTWMKARNAQRIHLKTVHPDGEPDCVCEHSVWYFTKRKAIGHHHHCETCHPRYRHGHTRVRLKRFMMASGLLPRSRQIKAVFYD